MIYYFFSYLVVSCVLALVFVHWMRPLSFRLGAVDKGHWKEDYGIVRDSGLW